ncbi:MAG TPA: hypothetical protein PLQ65_09480 [Flavihumibacter sp.]|nr:hypothetical protein [Bacteroidota bacterium]HQD09883.1 hypothetical protein [Flavihumibacter sp.]
MIRVKHRIIFVLWLCGLLLSCSENNDTLPTLPANDNQPTSFPTAWGQVVRLQVPDVWLP